ncbi:AraC family transcriptional regulator [Ancylobacter terrae]|uniref:AraC family transcriptional regulator n=1 Tax=Ancylobacter sp. sgz301288 TaxID=3342077 RepID=UPI003859C625
MTTGQQRVGALTHVPDVLRGFGIDPAIVAADAGLALSDLADREGQIPFTAACRLMQAGSEHARCPHFGLLVGQRNASESLGIVGRLMRNAPTLGRALLDLAENQHRYVRGAAPYVIVRGDLVWTGYGVYQRDAIGYEHMEDGAVAVGFNLMRELSGVAPTEVRLARRPPADPRPYHSFFGVPVRFNENQSALVFPASLLERPVAGADGAERRLLEARVRDYWAIEMPRVSDQVARLLRSRILFDDAGITAVARALSMHPRLLERALKREETTFRDLLNQTRAEVARRLLTATRLSVTEIGAAIGYGDTSAFSNAFRRMTGASPRAWRSRPSEGVRDAGAIVAK